MSHALINYPHIASMVFDTPLYATPTLVQSVRSVLEPRLLGKATDLPDGINLGSDTPEEREMQHLQVVGRMAIIPVHGVLVARRGTINAACEELVSYERLRTQITAALNHEFVEEIVLDFHTGGGHAMGCKELADFIRASTATKPITALVNFAAYSAGYFLAAACSRIVCSPTAGVGSIGVIIETFEVSRMEEEAGIVFNTFFRGDHKNDGSPHEPITDQAVAEINHKLDVHYTVFTDAIAAYRGMSTDEVVSTQARLYTAEDALAAKLIDEIAPAQDAVDAIAQRYSSQSSNTGPVRSIRAQARALDAQCQL
ncbi:S49 family peptidase [Chromohalobacter sp. TMW 2.2308]|uniref:S49 family peptidase n=1 Tax=Chromohalobacter moromii TaxID=2860329 RepID=A0A9X3B4A9_9GAMM|nr:S49 family peptidase [Chromohalobacter moromii]MCK2042558.1 S49 family peptidase [Chromohalobacter moromii]MCT8506145.1 S49 family peptidase [Chromohalobacter moromii]